ncbi:MAG TPA: hypothetical protein PLU50_11480, partial [Pseudobdellovibrionaceae bacterium]|nr:hypothetical protein [Pseudobdellovibrionaceae bacterium]
MDQVSNQDVGINDGKSQNALASPRLMEFYLEALSDFASGIGKSWSYFAVLLFLGFVANFIPFLNYIGFIFFFPGWILGVMALRAKREIDLNDVFTGFKDLSLAMNSLVGVIILFSIVAITGAIILVIAGFALFMPNFESFAKTLFHSMQNWTAAALVATAAWVVLVILVVQFGQMFLIYMCSHRTNFANALANVYRTLKSRKWDLVRMFLFSMVVSLMGVLVFLVGFFVSTILSWMVTVRLYEHFFGSITIQEKDGLKTFAHANENLEVQ